MSKIGAIKTTLKEIPTKITGKIAARKEARLLAKAAAKDSLEISTVAKKIKPKNIIIASLAAIGTAAVTIGGVLLAKKNPQLIGDAFKATKETIVGTKNAVADIARNKGDEVKRVGKHLHYKFFVLPKIAKHI